MKVPLVVALCALALSALAAEPGRDDKRIVSGGEGSLHVRSARASFLSLSAKRAQGSWKSGEQDKDDGGWLHRRDARKDDTLAPASAAGRESFLGDTSRDRLSTSSSSSSAPSGSGSDSGDSTLAFVEVYKSGEETIEFHGAFSTVRAADETSASPAGGTGSNGASLERSLVRVVRGDGRRGTVTSSRDDYAGVKGQSLVTVRYGDGKTESLLVVSDRGVFEGRVVESPLPSSGNDGAADLLLAADPSLVGRDDDAPLAPAGENGGVCGETGTCLPAPLCASQGGSRLASSSGGGETPIASGCASAGAVCCDVPRDKLFRTSRVDGFAKKRLFWRDPEAWRSESRKQQRVLGSLTARRIPGAALAPPHTIIALPRAEEGASFATWADCESACEASETCGAWTFIPRGVTQRYIWGGMGGNTLEIGGNALDLGLNGYRSLPSLGSSGGLPHPPPMPRSSVAKCFLHGELISRGNTDADDDQQYAVLPCRTCESGVKDWAVHDNFGQLREVFFSMRELLQFYRAEMLGVVAAASEQVELSVIGRLVGADGAGVVAGTESRLRGAIDAVAARTREMAAQLALMKPTTAAGRKALEQQVGTLKAMAQALTENASKSAEWLSFLIARASVVDYRSGEAAELFAKSLTTEMIRGTGAASSAVSHTVRIAVANLGAAPPAAAADTSSSSSSSSTDPALSAAETLWSLRTAIIASSQSTSLSGTANDVLLAAASLGRSGSRVGSAIEVSTAEVAWVAKSLRVLAGMDASSSSSSSGALSLSALDNGDNLAKVTELWKKLGPKLAAVVGSGTDDGSVDMDALVEAVRRIGALARGDMSVKQALDAYDPKALLDFAAAAVSEATGVPADDLVFYAERAEIFHDMYKASRGPNGNPPKLGDVWSAARPLITKLLDKDGDGSIAIGSGENAVNLRVSDVDWAIRSIAELRTLRGQGTNDKLETIGGILGDAEGPVARILEEKGLQPGDAKFVLDRVIDLRNRDYEGAASALIERTRPVIDGFLEEQTGGKVTADDLLWAVDTIGMLRDGDKAGVRKALLGKAEEKFDPILGKHGLVWADLASIVGTLRSEGGTSLSSIAGILADDSNSAVAKVHGLADELLKGTGADADDLVFALQQIAKIRETGDYKGSALALLDRVEPRIDQLLADRNIPIKVADVKWAVETFRQVRATGDRRAGLESALSHFAPQIDSLMAKHGLDAGGKIGSQQVTWAVGVALDIAEGKTKGKDLSNLLREAHTQLGPALEGKLPGGVTLDDVAWAVDTYKAIHEAKGGSAGDRGVAINAAVDQAIDRFSSQIDTALEGSGFDAGSVRWAVTAVRDAKAGRYGDAAESALLAAEGKIRAVLAEGGSGVTFEDLQWGLETVRALPQIARDFKASPEDTAIAVLTGLPAALKEKLGGLGAPVEDIVWGLQAVKTVRDGGYSDAAQMVIDRFGPKYEAELAKHGLTVDDVRFVAATSFALVQKDTTANQAIRDTILRFGPRVGKAAFNTDVDWAVRSIERVVAGNKDAAIDEAVSGLVGLGVEKFSDRLVGQLESKVASLAKASEGKELSARDKAWTGVLASLKDEKFRKLLAETTVKGISYARGQRGKENIRGDLDELVFSAAGFFDQYFGFNTLGGQAHEELMKKRHDRVIPPVDTHVAGIMFESTRTFLESKLDLMVKQLADKPGWQFHAEVAFDKKQLRAIAGTQFADGKGELLFDFSVTDPFGDAPMVSAKARVNYEQGNFNMGGEVLVEQVGAFKDSADRNSRIAVQGFVTYTSGNTAAGLFFDAEVPLDSKSASVVPGSGGPGANTVIRVRSYVYHSTSDGKLNFQLDAGAQFVPNRQLLAEARFGLHYRLTDSLTVSAIGEMSYNRALGGSGPDSGGLSSQGITNDLFRDTGRPGGFATDRDGFNAFVGGEIKYQPKGTNWEFGVYGGARSYNGQRPSAEAGLTIKFKF